MIGTAPEAKGQRQIVAKRKVKINSFFIKYPFYVREMMAVTIQSLAEFAGIS